MSPCCRNFSVTAFSLEFERYFQHQSLKKPQKQFSINFIQSVKFYYILLTAPESNVKQGVTSTVEDNYVTNIFNAFITVFYPSPFSSGKEQR